MMAALTDRVGPACHANNVLSLAPIIEIDGMGKVRREIWDLGSEPCYVIVGIQSPKDPRRPCALRSQTHHGSASCYISYRDNQSSSIHLKEPLPHHQIK